MDKADEILYHEVLSELREIFNLTQCMAEQYLLQSNFLTVLKKAPIRAHHRNATSWAYEIVRQYNKMKELAKIPLIKTVEVLDDYKLIVTFKDETKKLYDAEKNLINDDAWQGRYVPLKNLDLFQQVRVVGNGFGLEWNNEVTIDYSEVWDRGDIID